MNGNKYPPCYNISHFHGLATIQMNEPMAMELCEVLEKNEQNSHVVNQIVEALKSTRKGYSEFVPETVNLPHFNLSYLLGRWVLNINRAAADKIQDDLNQNPIACKLSRPVYGLKLGLKSFVVPNV